MMKKKNLSLATYVAAGALSLPAAAVALFFNVTDAQACGGDPPPPQCGVSLGCLLAVGETAVADSAMPVSTDVQAAMNLIITGNDPRCPSQTGALSVDLQASCETATGTMAPGGSGMGTATLVNGVNEVTFPVSFGAGPARKCELTGTANVTLSSGQSTTATCSPKCVALTDASPMNPSEPAIALRLKDTNYISQGAAGQPQFITYEVVNNGSESFDGTVDVSTGNDPQPTMASAVPAPSPDPATVCPATPPGAPAQPADCSGVAEQKVCGCDAKVYKNTCVMGNAGVAKYSDDATHNFCNPKLPAGVFHVMAEDGDDFPAAIVDGEDFDPCLAINGNTDMTAPSVQQVAVSVPAGETREVTIVVRPFAACNTCSTNQMEVKLVGNFASALTPSISCGGAAVVVNAEVSTTVTPVPTMCPDTPTTTPTCDAGDVCCNAPEGTCDDDGTPVMPMCEGDDCCTRVGDADCDGIVDDDETPTTGGTDPNDDDTDDDGINDATEIQTGTDPTNADTDNDLVPDNVEIENGTDPNNADTDGDGVNDATEIQTGSNPLVDDTDGDGLLDGVDGDVFNPDVDGDGILDGVDSDLTTPRGPDSDGDGITDATETMIYGTNPNALDSDGDGINDGDEVNGVLGIDGKTYRSNPALVDSDGDGLSDGSEINLSGTNPLVGDTDHDGLSDGDEVNLYGTNPLLGDTDGAGARDGDEIANGYDPNSSADDAHFLNSRLTKAAITLVSRDPLKSIQLVKDATRMAALDIRRQYASIQNPTSQIGRIHETIEINSASLPAAGETFEVTVEFSSKMQSKDSAYSIDKLEMGLKPQGRTSDFKGLGTIQVSSQPNTVFEVLYTGSVWAANPVTGQIERLEIVNPVFSMDSAQGKFSATFGVKSPNFETSTLYFMSDVTGSERNDFETTCNDQMDDDNDGAIDCNDSDCQNAANCKAGDFEVCGDGIDNNNDGKTDCEDITSCGASCAQPELCADGLDNDKDGLTDCNDSDCAGDSVCTTGPTGPAALCPDGTVAPNGDLSQCDDGGCGGCSSTGSAPFAPLALLAFGLVALRRRRREDQIEA